MVCDPSAIRTEIIRVGEGGATDCLFFLAFVIRSFSFSTRPCVFWVLKVVLSVHVYHPGSNCT